LATIGHSVVSRTWTEPIEDFRRPPVGGGDCTLGLGGGNLDTCARLLLGKVGDRGGDWDENG